MLSAIAATMPKRSVTLPVATPPRPKPSMVSVKASDTAPRVAPNSAWTNRQHHHDRPHADAADRADQKRQRKPHPGLTRVGGEERRISGWIGGSVHGRNFVARGPGVNRHGAIMGMQMRCNRAFPSPLPVYGERPARIARCETGEGALPGLGLTIKSAAAEAPPHPDPLPAPRSHRGEREKYPVNAFLTINWAKIAQ